MSTDIAFWAAIINSSVWAASANQPYGFIAASAWVIVALAILIEQRRREST